MDLAARQQMPPCTSLCSSEFVAPMKENGSSSEYQCFGKKLLHGGLSQRNVIAGTLGTGPKDCGGRVSGSGP